MFGPKNIPNTVPKRGLNPSRINAENVLFFNIDFFRFRPRFWRALGFQLGAKSAALLAAPGVLDPTAFLPSLTYCFSFLRGGQIEPNSRVELGLVGSMLGHFSVLGAFFSILAGS